MPAAPTTTPAPPRRARLIAAALTASVLTLAAACGDSGPDADSLSPAAREGQQLYGSRGCSGCHGGGGSGGIGPTLAGVAGTERELDDGRIVVADDDYLRRSIVDPTADIVAGYNVRMPQTSLSDDEVEALVAFIKELEPTS